MGGLLARVLPLALGSAVSPTALAAAVVVMASRTRPVARGVAFAVGFVVVLAGYTVLGLTLLSRVTPHPSPTAGRISGAIDLTLGLVLLAFGVKEALVAAPDPAAGPDDVGGPKGDGVGPAFALGAVLMLTNFTSLVLFIPALQDVHRSTAGESAKAVAVGLLVVCTALPVLVPLVGRCVAPRATTAALDRLGSFMTGHQRTITVVVALGFGAYLLVRGLVRV